MSLSPDQSNFLDRATLAARNATCTFPQMVACEAALESAYGTSNLAKKYNNLFGLKTHRHNLYGSVSLPTREFLDGEWVQTSSDFETYRDWDTCFFDRLSTLIRLSGAYPHYAGALNAPDAETYIREVSQTWSTDPNRAANVTALYNEYAKS